MPTKKASKKAQKKSGKKKPASKKAASRKTGGKKASAKKSAASAKAGKKAAAKGVGRKVRAQKAARRSSKKAAGGRAVKAAKAPAKALATAEALVGNCIGLGTAGTFVERAVIAVGGISPADFDIDKKFEAMGVISANQCALVRQLVLNAVRAFPCVIDDGDVTCAPGDKARAMRDAVQASAGKPA